MSAFLEVLVAAAAISAAASNVALANADYDQACRSHAHTHCR